MALTITVNGIEQDLEFFSREYGKFIVEVGSTLLQVIQVGTPVDTGHARNNWIPEIGSITGRVIGSRESPGSPQGDGAIQRWQPGAGDITIHNSVEYIVYLDQGSSAQAPQGIVDPAVAAVEGRFRGGP